MSDRHEKRGFTRTALPFPSRILHPEGVIESHVGLDVSASGLSIETDSMLPIGTACQVEIALAPSIVIEAKATVVRHLGDDGLAVEFNEIGLRSFDLLKNLIRFNADDIEVVDREFSEHLGLLVR